MSAAAVAPSAGKIIITQVIEGPDGLQHRSFRHASEVHGAHELAIGEEFIQTLFPVQVLAVRTDGRIQEQAIAWTSTFLVPEAQYNTNLIRTGIY